MIEAVPAYNTNKEFHRPESAWVGFVGVRRPAGLSHTALMLAAFLCARPCGAALAAEELSIVAQVDKSQVQTGEPLLFSLTIAGSLKQAPKVRLNAFEGFQVLATGQSQQIQIENGRTRQSLTLTYTLAPLSPGKHTLGPVKVEYEGKVYETQPVEVTVAEPPAASSRPELKGGVIL